MIIWKKKLKNAKLKQEKRKNSITDLKLLIIIWEIVITTTSISIPSEIPIEATKLQEGEEEVATIPLETDFSLTSQDFSDDMHTNLFLHSIFWSQR